MNSGVIGDADPPDMAQLTELAAGRQRDRRPHAHPHQHQEAEAGGRAAGGVRGPRQPVRPRLQPVVVRLPVRFVRRRRRGGRAGCGYNSGRGVSGVKTGASSPRRSRRSTPTRPARRPTRRRAPRWPRSRATSRRPSTTAEAGCSWCYKAGREPFHFRRRGICLHVQRRHRLGDRRRPQRRRSPPRGRSRVVSAKTPVETACTSSTRSPYQGGRPMGIERMLLRAIEESGSSSNTNRFWTCALGISPAPKPCSHPRSGGGPLYPDSFLDVAEETGLTDLSST